MAVANWWYLSFADEHSFRGGCFIRACDLRDAVREAAALGCAPDLPGGSVVGFPLETETDVPPWRFRNRLLTQAELDSWHETEPLLRNAQHRQ